LTPPGGLRAAEETCWEIFSWMAHASTGFAWVIGPVSSTSSSETMSELDWTALLLTAAAADTAGFAFAGGVRRVTFWPARAVTTFELS
jgi:hypothetical protein